MADGTMEAWVVDVEKALANSLAEAEGAQWTAHSIYRVPARMKSLDAVGAYKPRTVSLGPYHHGDPDLLSMEVHKRRALRHVVRRSGKTVTELVAAVEEVADQLESAYADLGDEWRGPGNRSRFLQVMVTDGCFLLEVMRMAVRKDAQDYAPNDPVFSRHGLLYTVPHIRLDMVLMENQLPLLLLQKINAIEAINPMVLGFVLTSYRPLLAGIGPGLHPLDVIRRSILSGEYRTTSSSEDTGFYIPSALELYHAGIRIKANHTDSLYGISFRHGVLSLPIFPLDESSELMFLNMMAFERLHVGAGNNVTEFVQFLGNIILSAEDVELLSSEGILQNMLDDDEVVARMFKRITADFVLVQGSALNHVYQQVHEYYWSHPCRSVNWCLTHFIRTYFHSPWKAISLFAATVLLVLAIMQTVYTVLSFYSRRN
uniref:Uncharacterized protein n=1 Tax=Avena sativa TaxID=4498 RepID=A0ACD5UCJ8_AVESA